jgi:hypothetical protein
MPIEAAAFSQVLIVDDDESQRKASLALLSDRDF